MCGFEGVTIPLGWWLVVEIEIEVEVEVGGRKEGSGRWMRD